MALTSGTKLGPYEIQSPLGAGGMGEVSNSVNESPAPLTFVLNWDVELKK